MSCVFLAKTRQMVGRYIRRRNVAHLPEISPTTSNCVRKKSRFDFSAVCRNYFHHLLPWVWMLTDFGGVALFWKHIALEWTLGRFWCVWYHMATLILICNLFCSLAYLAAVFTGCCFCGCTWKSRSHFTISGPKGEMLILWLRYLSFGSVNHVTLYENILEIYTSSATSMIILLIYGL